MGWHPRYFTSTTTPINPDLDAIGTGMATITAHPTEPNLVLLHAEDGRHLHTIPLRKLHQLHSLHSSDTPLALDIRDSYSRSKAFTKLRPAKTSLLTPPSPVLPATQITLSWPIPDATYDAFHNFFTITRMISADPYTIPTSLSIYYSPSPSDSRFSALPLMDDMIWPGTTLDIPPQEPNLMIKALERAVAAAHRYRHKLPTATILILPDSIHTSFMKTDLQKSPYVHRMARFPRNHPGSPRRDNQSLILYCVSNALYRDTLRRTPVSRLRRALEGLYGEAIWVSPFSHYTDAPRGSPVPYRHPFTTAPKEILRKELAINKQPLGHKTLPYIKPFSRKWDPTDFVYTDGSLVKGRDTLGAAAVFPTTQTTITIEVQATPERFTINRAELAAISVALERSLTWNHISILTDSAFSINSIRNYCHTPHRYQTNTHRALLHKIHCILRDREVKGLSTHLGKVKSHTNIHYNEVADQGAKSVVMGSAPDVLYSDDNPSTTGHRTWIQSRIADKDPVPLRDPKTQINKLIRAHRPGTLSYNHTTHGEQLRRAVTQGADFSIHTKSQSPYINRRDAMEIAWGSAKSRLYKGKVIPLCRHCLIRLTNSHLAGDCPTKQRLRTDRHNSTFLLLHELLQESNGGRWPILAMDLGRKPIKDFEATPVAEIIRHTTSSPPLGATSDPEDGWKDSAPQTTVPEYILPKHSRPRHYKPDMVRAVGFYQAPDGTLAPDPNYHGRRYLQLIECKYSTDHDSQDIIANINEKYRPLVDAIRAHNTWPFPVEIIPIVITRTGSFNVKTLAEIAQLVSPQEEPPDALTYRELPQEAKRIVMKLHVHAQHWLHLILQISKADLPLKHTAARPNTRKRKFYN